MLLNHPMRDLSFTLVTEVSFSVRIEVINAVSLQEAGMLPRADILPLAVFTEHFQLDYEEIMIKGGGIILDVWGDG